MKLLKIIVGVLAVATAVAVGLSIAAPNLLSSNDVQGILTSPAEGLQKLAEKGSSKVGELAERGTSKIAEMASSAADKVSTEAVNQMVDQSGLKEAAEAELHAHAGDIAAIAGMDEGTVDYIIDSMDIPSWQATALPDTAYPQASIPLSYAGTGATITTYDDTGYMTVDAYGQSVTFAVPEAAQAYVPYLGYIQ